MDLLAVLIILFGGIFLVRSIRRRLRRKRLLSKYGDDALVKLIMAKTHFFFDAAIFG